MALLLQTRALERAEDDVRESEIVMMLGPHPPPETPSRRARRPRVLVAEDDRTSRHLMRSLLERRGYDVEVVSTGVALHERLARRPHSREQDAVDLVITDVYLPGMTGLEVVEALRPRVRLPAVILVSSFADDALRRRARELGIRAVLDKPFDLADLYRSVAAALLSPVAESPASPGAGSSRAARPR